MRRGILVTYFLCRYPTNCDSRFFDAPGYNGVRSNNNIIRDIPPSNDFRPGADIYVISDVFCIWLSTGCANVYAGMNLAILPDDRIPGDYNDPIVWNAQPRADLLMGMVKPHFSEIRLNRICQIADINLLYHVLWLNQYS